jgi:3',5'-cyclic-AMP phosphodiesterase
MRIAIITDIHLGPNTGNVFGDQALELLAGVLPAIAHANPELLLELGDRLTDIDPASDEANLRQLAARFVALPYPRLHLCGNHDLLPRQLQAELLGQDLGNRAIVQGGWQLLCLDTSVPPELGPPTIGGVITPHTLEFARDHLASGLPTVVASHQPLHGAALIGNRYFEHAYAEHACPQGAAALRAVFAAHPPRLCLSGHAHWTDSRWVAGVPYLTVQSLSESWASQGLPAQAWALLELPSDPHDRIRVEVFGRNPLTATYPPQPTIA